MSSDLALRVIDVTKGFNLPSSPLDRVLQGFSFGKLGRTRRHEVLRGVNFEICRGETVALLGVNGAGKSTLLQMIAGTMAPSGGRIEVTGKVAALLELGAGFSPDFTGRENAILNARLLGVTESEARALLPWIIEFSGIGESVDRPVRYYSSGMFVRLAFAVAAAVRPDVMIIDEALGVGDAAFQAKCYQYLKHELGHVTKIIVSHDTAMVGAMANRVVVLGNGTVIHDGTVSEGMEVYHRSIKPKPTLVVSDGDHLSIEALRVDGRTQSNVRAGQVVEIEVLTRNASSSERRMAGTVLIEDAFGQAIAGNDGDAHDVPLFDMPAGVSRHRLRCKWPPLRAGQYVLRISAVPSRFVGSTTGQDDGMTATVGLEGVAGGSNRAIMALEVQASKLSLSNLGTAA